MELIKIINQWPKSNIYHFVDNSCWIKDLDKLYEEHEEEIWDLLFEMSCNTPILRWLTSNPLSEDVYSPTDFKRYLARLAVEFICRSIIGKWEDKDV